MSELNELWGELMERHDIELSGELLSYAATGRCTSDLDSVLDQPNYQACIADVIRELSRPYAEMIGV